MRRGLISWSPGEVPAAVLDGRVAKLQAAMRAEKLDAVLAYTSHAQPAAVTWLTHFVPYWNDGLVVVLQEGPPVLLAAFSRRVQEWIRSVCRVGDVITSPDLGKGALALLAARAPGIAAGKARVGIIERDDFPWHVAQPLAEGGLNAALADATQVFASVRHPSDDAEVGLAAHALSLARRSLDSLSPGPVRASQVLAAIESAARLDGAEEVLARIAPDLAASGVLRRIEGDAAIGERFAVQLSIAYKGVWVRSARCFARAGTAATPASWKPAREWFAGALAGLDAANCGAGPARDGCPGTISGWTIEASIGYQPLATVAQGGPAGACAEHVLPAGALCTLCVSLQTAHGPWHGAAPFLLAAKGAPSRPLG